MVPFGCSGEEPGEGANRDDSRLEASRPAGWRSGGPRRELQSQTPLLDHDVQERVLRTLAHYLHSRTGLRHVDAVPTRLVAARVGAGAAMVVTVLPVRPGVVEDARRWQRRDPRRHTVVVEGVGLGPFQPERGVVGLDARPHQLAVGRAALPVLELRMGVDRQEQTAPGVVADVVVGVRRIQ